MTMIYKIKLELLLYLLYPPDIPWKKTFLTELRLTLTQKINLIFFSACSQPAFVRDYYCMQNKNKRVTPFSMVLQRTIASRHMNHKGEFGGKRHRMVHIQLTSVDGTTILWTWLLLHMATQPKKHSKSLKGPIFVDNCVRNFVLRNLEGRK